MVDTSALSAPSPAVNASAATVEGDAVEANVDVTGLADAVQEIKEEAEGDASEEMSSDDTSVFGTPQAPDSDQIDQTDTQNFPNVPVETDGEEEEEEEEEEGEGEGEDEPLPKKQKQLSDLPETEPTEPEKTEFPSVDGAADVSPSEKPKSNKKSKKKSKDVWTTTSRKGKKKTKHASGNGQTSKNGNAEAEEKVLITPVPRFPDKNDDSPDMEICLSKVNKAEKVELSEDRLTAGSIKGFRMVRATRGVTEGAWYFEIKVMHLGESGHTRLGWSTDKGELQAPVGYDGNSFGYRDVDGSKVHKAMRETYGSEGYKEGDVIGFYINLPDGGAYAPSTPRLVWYKGQRYVCAPDAKEDPPKVVPGSEISFFKNGICQGVAFKDLNGGRYYPAASMYTLPNQPNCVVKFNFGPDFESFPDDFGERPIPKPMIEVPYQGYDHARLDNSGTGPSEKKDLAVN